MPRPIDKQHNLTFSEWMNKTYRTSVMDIPTVEIDDYREEWEASKYILDDEMVEELDFST